MIIITNKRIMNNFVDNINEDIDIHQKRIFLEDPKDKHVGFITNAFIYSSFHYPFTKTLIDQLITRLVNKHSHVLQGAILHLFSCLKREVIHGPSSSHNPPSQIPENHKKDMSLDLYPLQDNHQALQQFIKANQQLNLKDLLPENRLKQLLWYNCSQFLSTKSVQETQGNYKYYEKELQIDGQSWLQSTPFSYMFCFLIYTLQKILSHPLSEQIQKNLRLTWARLAYLHNKHLNHPVKRLSEIVLSNYKRVIQIMVKKTTFQDYIELLLEYSFCLLFYYKYNPCQQILRQCSKMVNMKIQFTGKLGRRTKYQQFDTAQLVMNLIQNDKAQKVEQDQPKTQYEEYQKEQSSKLEFIDPKQLLARQRGISLQQSKDIIKSTYDQESILLQTPKYVQEQQTGQNKQLKEINEYHLLVSLAIMHYHYRSTPHDEMLYQNITAAIMTLLKYQVKTSFSYNFSILLLRSLNQFPRIKHCQRALDQLQKLKRVYNNIALKNTSNVFSTPYQTYLSYILVLASKYMEMGLSLTAISLFEEAKLYQQCIDGLISKNYKEKALELINKLISEKGKSARLLCMLGDLYKDETKHYYEAWELSNKTNARSMRSLGWYYFAKNDFQKAAQSFHNATVASYYHPSTWFTLGCSYMNLKQFDKALKAFSECISIDQTQGQAWGNMASCYMHTKRLREACTTLEQAVKYSESNWKLWANLITVSLSVKKFYKYFESIQKVVKLGHQQVLTQEMMKKVIQIMVYKNESQQRRRILYNFKRRIDGLYEFLQQKIGENPLVWRSRSEYERQVLEYHDIMNVHYHNLHVKNALDINDLIPGYQTKESTALIYLQSEKQGKRKVIEYKQNELNMVMKIGWHDNKIETQRVKKILLQYTEIYKMYSDRSDKEDFKLFLNGVAQKISFCLEVPFQVSIAWL